MKLLKTVDAVGHILCHDLTRIVAGESKDAAFRKGHIIKEEDIPLLLSMGKEHIYIWENTPGMIHENDAAEILCEICRGANLSRSDAKEGKITLSASVNGLLKADREKLNRLNGLGQISAAARHGNFPVKAGEAVAGVRVIPLIIEDEKMKTARELCGTDPIFKVLPFKLKKAGLVVTGSEVFHGRIKDTFTPVLERKLAEYGAEIGMRAVVGDEHEKITRACIDMIEAGMELVMCSGGMSVDPDDRTPLAIKNSGARIVSYGAPVLPGSMFMLAYYSSPRGEIPIVGLPGCVMYAERTIFDLILPRLAAGDPVHADDITRLGHGGLCLNCSQCAFPNCGFGKGG